MEVKRMSVLQWSEKLGVLELGMTQEPGACSQIGTIGLRAREKD